MHRLMQRKAHTLLKMVTIVYLVKAGPNSSNGRLVGQSHAHILSKTSETQPLMRACARRVGQQETGRTEPRADLVGARFGE
jgi:hypothetical protein